MKICNYHIHERRVLGGLIAAIYLLLQFQGCAEIPITHRKGLRLVPETELLSMSLQQYDEVLKKSKLSTDTHKVEMVRRIGNRIAKAAEAFFAETGQQDKIKNYKWEFNLIEDDKIVNAWVMPGGKAAVYSGILPYTQNETGLAVVLGHEVAHALADHGNERMSEALVANMGGKALSVALSQQPQQTQQLFMTVYGVGANVGFLLPYSRLHESEADELTHRSIETLHKTFVTPFDRQDILRLIVGLDDILDTTEAVSSLLNLYNPRNAMQEAMQLADLLVQGTEKVAVMVGLLRQLSKQSDRLLALGMELNHLENEADRAYQQAIARLFQEEDDPKEVIKWKDILEHIETATDQCEDVADIIEGIVLENA